MKSCWAVLVMLLLAAISPPIHAQKHGQPFIDSLKTRLANSEDDSNKVTLLNNLSFAYVKVDPDEGMKYAHQSLAVATEIKWRLGEAWARNAIANIYLAKSEYPKALDYYFKALKQMEDIGDKIAISIISGNIGSVYYVQGNYTKTLEFCFRALHYAEETGNRKSQLNNLGNIGNVYNSLGNYPEAVKYLSRAIKIAEELDSQEDVVKNVGNLANVYSALRDYPKALEYNFRALQLAEQLELKSSKAVDLGNIGETYLAMAKDTAHHIVTGKYVPGTRSEKLNRAISFLDQGVAACRQIGYLAPMAEFSGALSEAYRLKGDYKAALESYEQFIVFKDSVYSAANKIKIAHLETQRAIDLKNKQIEIDRLAVEKKRNERGFFIVGIGLLLIVIIIIFRNYKVQMGLNQMLSAAKRKVELHTEELDHTNNELNTALTNLKETQQQLIQSEKLKENEMIRSRISQDIHDDISSELTRISWVSELAKSKVRKDDYQDMPGLLEKITLSSRETVTKLGEIIWTVNPKNDSLASLLAYMRTHIDKFFADTEFTYKIDFPEEGTDVHMNPELKRNLYLVMKEALNNIVKYSCAKLVHISLELSNNDYRFCITDDGKGIEEGTIQGSGNGLGNMRRRMESVQGCCIITSARDKGTEVCCSGKFY